MNLKELENNRHQMLEKIHSITSQDPDIVSVWLTGSYAYNTADEWSDLDLHLAIKDEPYENFLEKRTALFNKFGKLALAQELRVNNESAAFFTLLIYTNGVEIDCSLWSLKDAHRIPNAKVLFDKAEIKIDPPQYLDLEKLRSELKYEIDFFWAMAAVGAKVAGRGNVYHASHMLALMTDSYDCLWRFLYTTTNQNPRQFELRRRPRIQELDEKLPKFGTKIDVLECIKHMKFLCNEVEMLHKEIAKYNVEIPNNIYETIMNLQLLAERQHAES